MNFKKLTLASLIFTGVASSTMVYASPVPKTTYTAVDHSNVLRSYNRSHGLVSITDTISIANELSTSGEIGAEAEDFISMSLGYSFSASEAEEFAIEWSETYDYPVILDVYGKYKYIEGDIYEDDVWYDDYLGDFTAKIAIGDAIAVTRVK